jgi:hypothetical protein
MAYRIEEKNSIFEVYMWGQISRWEVLEIVRQMQHKDPRKESCDLWIFDEISGVSFDEFPGIVKAVAGLCSPDMVGNKTALVVCDEFLKSQLELYRAAASGLPFEIRVFATQEEAHQWLRS